MNSPIEFIENIKIVKHHHDHKYIMALVNNQTDLIEDIYKEHSDLIKMMVLKNNGSMTEAKDLFQDCLIQLYKMGIDGFILTCPLKSFLYLMCKRKWLNEIRRKKTKGTQEFSDILENQFSEDAEQLYSQFNHENLQWELMKENLAKLGLSCQKIIQLSWTQNSSGKYMKWNDIADQLDLSYGYVRKKAAECKAKLVELVRLDPNFKRLLNE